MSNSTALQNYKRLLSKLDQSDFCSTKVHFFASNSEASSYEVFGEHAEDLCRALYRPTSSLRHHHDAIVSLLITEQALPVAIRECLFVQSWAVAVVSFEGRVVREATPGNVSGVEDLIESEPSSDPMSSSSTSTSSNDAVVAAVVVKDGKVGIAAVQGMEVTVCEFEDDPFLTTTETCLVQLAVKEVLVMDGKACQTDGEQWKLRSIAQSLNCVITPLKQSIFDEQVGEQDLSKLAKNQSDCLKIIQERPFTLKAMAALCGYMNLLSFDAAYHQYTVSEHPLTHFMRLDETALRSLDLFPKNQQPLLGQQQKQRVDSLFTLLNKCRTGQGSRLLGQWIRQPLKDVTLINQRLDIQEALVGDPVLARQLQDCLKGCSDLQRAGKRLFNNRARLQDLLCFHQVIQRSKQLLLVLSNSASLIVKSTFETPLSQILSNLTPFEAMIEASVDMEAVERHEYLVKADFDATLQAIAHQKDQLLGDMNLEFQQLSIKCGLERFKKLKMERSPVYGHHFRVSRLDFNTAKQASNTIIEYAVQKAGLLFATVRLKELSEQYRCLEGEFMAKQANIVKEMVRQTATFKESFDALNSVLAVVDVSVALSVSATTAVREYCRPVFVEGTMVEIVEGRHPVLEEICATGPMRFVENDYKVTANGPHFMFITGPNMGGKSTFMRQIALIAIMAQMGCFVPASRARLPVFDGVLVRVGAGDNLARGLSTFQAEMQEMSSILRTATKHSLLLIDELGRGTSTTEGFGLAWAISKHIAAVGPVCLFATHFHELAALAVECPTLFGNLRVCVEYGGGGDDNDDVRMEFKVEEGASERSFGVHCAKMAGFPRNVRVKAAAQLAGLEGRLENLDTIWLEQCINVIENTDNCDRWTVFEKLLVDVDESTRSVIREIMHS